MFIDSPLATLTENDGIITLMHCQEWNFEDYHDFDTKFVQIPSKVEMFNAWQMHCIHIPANTTEMHSPFKNWSRPKIFSWKTNRIEKNWLFSIFTGKQFVLRPKSSKTMQKWTQMSSRELFQERSRVFLTWLPTINACNNDICYWAESKNKWIWYWF